MRRHRPSAVLGKKEYVFFFDVGVYFSLCMRICTNCGNFNENSSFRVTIVYLFIKNCIVI